MHRNMQQLLRITVLLLLVFATASMGSEGAIDCCLATSNNRIPSRIVKTYAVQTTNEGCRVDATLFITKKGKKLCAPPASEQKWVRDIIKRLSRKGGQSDKGCRRGKNRKSCRNRQ